MRRNNRIPPRDLITHAQSLIDVRPGNVRWAKWPAMKYLYSCGYSIAAIAYALETTNGSVHNAIKKDFIPSDQYVRARKLPNHTTN